MRLFRCGDGSILISDLKNVISNDMIEMVGVRSKQQVWGRSSRFVAVRCKFMDCSLYLAYMIFYFVLLY